MSAHMERDNWRVSFFTRMCAFFFGLNLGAAFSHAMGIIPKDRALHDVAMFSTYMVLAGILRAVVKHHFPDPE